MYKIIKASWVRTVEPEVVREEFREEFGPGLLDEIDNDEVREPEPAIQDEIIKINAQEILNLAVSQAEHIEEEARKQAEAIVRNAQEESRAYLSQAKIEAESIKETAFQEGYQEGSLTGKDEAQTQLAARMEPDIRSFNALLHALDEQQELFLLSQDIPILELILSVTEKILGTATAIRPELIQHIIKNVLVALNETGRIIIKVNPVHIPYLNDHGAIFDDIDPDRLQIEEDPEIKPGSCHVETEMGFTDVDIDEQMEILKSALREETYHARL